MKESNITESAISRQRHSAAHLLAMAVLKHHPTAKLAIGPAIEDGFYYDFGLDEPLSEADLPVLEDEMRRLIKANLSFERTELPVKEAIKQFNDQPYKQELINDLATNGEKTVSLYRTGEFVDLCRGGHVNNTGEIPADGLKLSRIAGAYWRGDANRPMLVRIYGLLFENGAVLAKHLENLQLAEERDHKKLGPALELFSFSELVGPGLPLWLPKGALMRQLLDDYVWQLRRQKGYDRVAIPHITKKELYETSGHWSKFADELFRITSREGHQFAIKPMNCPHHTQIYQAKQRSYRDLPQRYAETTMCYRDEQTGELLGLSRVRGFTQDDAHVFCRHSQIESEIMAIWDIIDQFYTTFGFDLSIRFSRHDKDQMEKYLGDEKVWQVAEGQLLNVIKQRQVEYADGLGEAALYGPKIDFLAVDALGRKQQVATIQLDLNLPERFDLYCINEVGDQERIVMIHAAIMGSLERFMAVLIEHYAGAFPLWLSPIQLTIIPVSDKFNNYCQEHVIGRLLAAGIRAEIDSSNESVGKKIRRVSQQKIPYSVVIGEKEVASGQLAVRSRQDGDLGSLATAELISLLLNEIEQKK